MVLAFNADLEHSMLPGLFSTCWRAGLPDKTSCWCSTARPIIAAATLPFLTTSRSCIFRPIPRNSIRRKTLWDELREKIFKNFALKSMDAVRAKLRQAILYIERNPKLVRSITSFPYIVNSL